MSCWKRPATYWKPFYYLLGDLPGVEAVLVNARNGKDPHTHDCRKTDVDDATWLAQLAAHGAGARLVRPTSTDPSVA